MLLVIECEGQDATQPSAQWQQNKRDEKSVDVMVNGDVVKFHFAEIIQLIQKERQKLQETQDECAALRQEVKMLKKRIMQLDSQIQLRNFMEDSDNEDMQ